tara:strand:- start:199 stop:453 length:255 start_codon:yes stop_codon:yes gene_type:complete
MEIIFNDSGQEEEFCLKKILSSIFIKTQEGFYEVVEYDGGIKIYKNGKAVFSEKKPKKLPKIKKKVLKEAGHAYDFTKSEHCDG